MRSIEIIGVFSRLRQECSLNNYNLPFEDLLPVEKELIASLQQVSQATASELKSLRESVDLHLAVLLNRFARRMANAAVYKHRDDLLQSALIAVSLDNDLLDDREVYRTGALILDSIQRRKLDAAFWLNNHLVNATGNRRALLMRQLNTAPEYMRSLRSMRFGVVTDSTGFKYV